MSPKRPDRDSQEYDDRRFQEAVADFESGGIWAAHAVVSGMSDLECEVVRFEPDIAFCSFYKFIAQDGAPDYLRDALMRSGVAWIGSPNAFMELALAKSRIKAFWRSQGILTPDWFTIRRLGNSSIDGMDQVECAQDFPYIVKPANEGNSRGIDESSVVESRRELVERTVRVLEDYNEALVERYVAGGASSREFTAIMIGNGPKALVSAVELKAPERLHPVITEDDKRSEQTTIIPISHARLKTQVEGFARNIFLVSGARDYARCDILLHEGGLYAIELNGQPIVPERWFEACAMEAGLDPIQYMNAIALAGITGNARTGHAFIPIPSAMRRILPPQIYSRLSR